MGQVARWIRNSLTKTQKIRGFAFESEEDDGEEEIKEEILKKEGRLEELGRTPDPFTADPSRSSFDFQERR